MFTEKEVAYLNSQPLARLATVAPDGQPDVAPVGFEFDGQHIFIGGHNPTHTRKYRNLRAGNHKVALAVDDLESIQPWKPRGIRIYGTAELVEREGRFGPGTYMRITPTTSWSWGIGEPNFQGGKFVPHKTIHASG
jgi:pyridoxamine 5'-phosphate oxidase family protein